MLVSNWYGYFDPSPQWYRRYSCMIYTVSIVPRAGSPLLFKLEPDTGRTVWTSNVWSRETLGWASTNLVRVPNAFEAGHVDDLPAFMHACNRAALGAQRHWDRNHGAFNVTSKRTVVRALEGPPREHLLALHNLFGQWQWDNDDIQE